MTKKTPLKYSRLSVSDTPPYDPLQAFVRDNHIALQATTEGPLSGLVFAAKDVFMIKGSTFGNGHPEWLRTHEPDPFTAKAVQRLLDAGADLVGKTVCDELCFSISGENWNYGAPLNPYNPMRFTGGSSSGSAAATAGGLVDFAIGSDCLGSVRVPAAYNGLYGMRPTYKRVDNHGEAPYCASMDVLGYVAEDPKIFQQVSDVLLGPDQEELELIDVYIAEDGFNSVDEDVRLALQPALDKIKAKARSIQTIKIAPETLESWVETFRIVQGYEVWESYGGWIRHHRPRLSRGPKERLEWSSTITEKAYREALAKKLEIETYFETIMPVTGVLVLPTSASVAPLRETSLEEINRIRLQSTNLLCISPLAAAPQVTVPLSFQHDMPLGLTLMARRGYDQALVRFATSI